MKLIAKAVRAFGRSNASATAKQNVATFMRSTGRTRPMRALSTADGEAEPLNTELRVIHTPVNIANQPWTLSRHERGLGAESDVVVHFSSSFQFSADTVLGRAEGASDDELLARMDAGLRAPLEYDVLHFYFGRTLLTWEDYNAGSLFPYLDVRLAKALRRVVFFTLQGCDTRLAHRSHLRNHTTMCRKGDCQYFEYCVTTADAKRQNFIKEILPLADKVFYLNPELGHYVSGAEFLPYASIEVQTIKVTPPSQKGRIRIAHAPTNRPIKGTDYIIAALDDLKERFDFELILVEGLPHEKAMEIYRSSDIVIDQVLAGWYGAFAAEVMAMGKPVLCYLREEDYCHVPAEMIADLPIRNVRIETLADDIADVLARRDEWPLWSRRSRHFVEKWHDPATIAAAMLAAYRQPNAPMNFVNARAGSL